MSKDILLQITAALQSDSDARRDETLDSAYVEIVRLRGVAQGVGRCGAREALLTVRNWLDVQFNEPFKNEDLAKHIGIINDVLAASPAQSSWQPSDALVKVARMAKAAAEMELGFAASPDFSPREMLDAANEALSSVPSTECQCTPLTRYADAPHDPGCPLASSTEGK